MHYGKKGATTEVVFGRGAGKRMSATNGLTGIAERGM